MPFNTGSCLGPLPDEVVCLPYVIPGQLPSQGERTRPRSRGARRVVACRTP